VTRSESESRAVGEPSSRAHESKTAATAWRRAILAVAVLVVASLLPSPLDRHPAFRRVGPDKALHAAGHAWIAARLNEALSASGVSDDAASVGAVALSWLLAFAVGRLQQFVPGRVPERADLAAGAVGSVLGVGWSWR
jgi:VanZ family protein